MDDLALLNDYIASYTHRSLEYMEDKFVENEDLIGDAADTMWNRTLYTIASAVALRHKMEGPPHFCRQPKRYFEKVRVFHLTYRSHFHAGFAQLLGFINISIKSFRISINVNTLIGEH